MSTKGTHRRAAVSGQNEASERSGFWRDEDGSFIIFGLAVFMIMLIAGGIAVDTMRYETHRVHVQQTLDRAILAAASLDQPLDPKEVVVDYFAKAGLGHLISEDDVTVVEDSFSRKVSAELDMTMPTTFLRLANIHTLDMSSSGAAEEALSLVEISMVLDVSGSMDWSSASGNSKIYELRKAAKRFVNIMLCNPADPDETVNCTVETGNISISLVPYAEQVLLGDDLLQYFNHTNEHSESTCITFFDDEFDDVAVSTFSAATFATYGRPLPLSMGDSIQLTGYFDPYNYSHRTPDPEDYSPCYNDYYGSYTDEWREVFPWGHDADELRDEINDLDASGATSIDLGMKWGTALLDPAAQAAVTDMIAANQVDEDFAGRPYDYTKRGIEKVVVLMTDGENTSQDHLNEGFHSGPSGVYKANSTDDWSVYSADRDEYYWVDGGQWLDHAYGTGSYEHCETEWTRVWYQRYGRWYYYWDSEEVCETVNEGTGATELTFPELWVEKTTDWYNDLPYSYFDDASDSFDYYTKNSNLSDMCTAAKDAGIIVFTIGFEVNSSQDTIMSNCASADSYYFDVDGLDISAAFAAIAREISKLRLVY